MTTQTWFTKREAAAHLRVSLRTLDRYISNGQLTRHKLAGTQSVRFLRSELDALLEPEQPEDSETQYRCEGCGKTSRIAAHEPGCSVAAAWAEIDA